MEYFEKLNSLRGLMREHQIDACLVPVTDPHIGEYVPGHWRAIEWLTGFTGSAATVIVTRDFAGLWTDSRYFQQAKEQLDGTPFQRRVWQVLQKIPSGSTMTYGEVAQQIGSGARAVGNACRANPCPLIVPCHRVVGVDGLGGFSGERGGEKLEIKRWLLQHEGVL